MNDSTRYDTRECVQIKRIYFQEFLSVMTLFFFVALTETIKKQRYPEETVVRLHETSKYHSLCDC